MKKVLAIIAIAALVLSGCVNISDAAKAGSFGKKANEAKAFDYYKQKYGDPAGTGAPRFIEPMMTTSVVDNMPANKALIYDADASAFIVWFFYDNFGESDTISVTYRYLDASTDIHTFTAKGGGDYGAATFTLSEPDEGWPLGKYEVVISGKGVTERVGFEVHDGPNILTKLPFEEGGSATPTAVITSGVAPTAAPSATAKPAASGTPIFETDPGYLGACDQTDTAKFAFSSAMQVTVLQVWYNWAASESTVGFTLKKDGESFLSGVLERRGCDTYQKNWCNGDFDANVEFPAGTYELTLSSAKMCLQPGKTGAVRLYGTAPAATTMPKVNAQGYLEGCTYAGTWSTDWGTMVLAQDGEKVSGNYTWDSGRLAGTIVDGKFVGKWSESPSYAEPGDGGDAEFFFTKDCNSFTGNWHYGVHPAGAGWSGGWVGKK